MIFFSIFLSLFFDDRADFDCVALFFLFLFSRDKFSFILLFFEYFYLTTPWLNSLVDGGETERPLLEKGDRSLTSIRSKYSLLEADWRLGMEDLRSWI